MIGITLRNGLLVRLVRLLMNPFIVAGPDCKTFKPSDRVWHFAGSTNLALKGYHLQSFRQGAVSRPQMIFFILIGSPNKKSSAAISIGAIL